MIEPQKLKQIKLFFEQEDYENVIAFLEKCIEETPNELTYYWYLGLVYLIQKNEEEAQSIWLSVLLQSNLEEVEQWVIELTDFLETKVEENIAKRKLDNAKIIYETISAINPDYENKKLLNGLVESLSDLADHLSNDNHQETAIEVYLEILNLNSDHAISWYYLALNYYYLRCYLEAQEVIDKAIKLDNLSIEKRHHLNLILKEIKNYPSTIEEYQQLIKKDPTSIDAHYHLGNIYLQQGQVEDAIAIYRVAINLLPTSSRIPIFYKLATAYRAVGNQTLASLYFGHFAYSKRQNQVAIEYFQEFLSVQADDIDIDTCIRIAHCYMLIDQPISAITLIEKALNLFPNSLLLKRLNQVILPIIYQSTQEIKFYRLRFCQLLNQLIEDTNLDTLREQQEVVNSIQVATNFYLGYQGENDLEIQKKYGNYIYKITSFTYPQYCVPILLSQNLHQRKIRIGYISSHFQGLGELYLGWVKYSNKNNFENYIYDISGYNENLKKKSLDLTEKFREYSDNMQFFSGNVDSICTALKIDKLDILIFTEIGLDPIVNLLSCLHLAPIQCTTWGQPTTSGSPSIDYFLSSDLMEADNGEEHYSEKLVRLPNLGFSIESRIMPILNKERSDFDIRDNSVVYLCCQAMFKYLPQHDYIFPSIAQHNKLAQFVFIDSYLGPVITNSFKKRIDKAFSESSLCYEDYCVFLHQMKLDDYLKLNQLADIFLDSFGWSGGLTTKEAIACSLPIVTCPGKIMRARQSYGMLQMIGITETIAKTEAEYIEIAVRLGLDHEWRRAVREKMTANKHRLFNDQECIKGLESFFQEAIQKHSIVS
jgi:predicted O-linked N-acetylglucosamine transferase (SPINDLY family)